MNKTRIAINGFGRIGRTFFRMVQEHPSLEVCAINDLGDIKNLAYLLTYDTSYGHFGKKVEYTESTFIVDGVAIPFLQEKDVHALPWKDLEIDIVVESTGVFTSYEKASGHVAAGARRVVITAPVGNVDAEQIPTVLIGVNEERIRDCSISSNASCTTNAASPLIGILHDALGIEKALLSTVHAYTASQSLVDGPSKKDMREGRAAACNIVPSSTGAAIATTRAHTALTGKFDGISIRVPITVGSIVDITFISKRPTTAEEINTILTQGSRDPRWKTLFAVTNEPLVSSDIIGAHYAAIADLSCTKVVDGNLVKVLAWYDNETSYTSTLITHVERVAESIQKQ
jgi:glyceraldehyde 3-phosphate dehydrogenase